MGRIPGRAEHVNAPTALPAIEPATLCLPIAVLALLIAVMSAGIARTVPVRARQALRWWSLASLCAGVAFLLYLFRGHAPMLLTYVLANTLAVATFALSWMAHASIRQRLQPTRLAVIAVTSTACTVFGAQRGWWSGAAGAIVTCGVIAALSLAIGWIEAQAWRGERCISTLTSAAGAVLCGMGFAARVVSGIQQPAGFVPSTGMTGSIVVIFLLVAVYLVACTVNLLCAAHAMAQADIRETLAHDALTGLLNRAAFFERAGAWRRAGGGAAVMFDIDHFKAINDRHGHRAGDACIAHAAALLRDAVRTFAPNGTAGRYGGEEFCVFLPATGAREALDFAQDVLHQARERAVSLPSGQRVGYTLSGGVAHASGILPGDDTDQALGDLLDRADQALYAAKRSGRDRAVAASDPYDVACSPAVPTSEAQPSDPGIAKGDARPDDGMHSGHARIQAA